MKRNDMYERIISLKDKEIIRLEAEVAELKRDKSMLDADYNASDYCLAEETNKSNYMQRHSMDNMIGEIYKACGLYEEKEGGAND